MTEQQQAYGPVAAEGDGSRGAAIAIIVGALAVAALTAATVLFLQWRSGADALGGDGPTGSIESAEVGGTYYVDAGFGPADPGADGRPESVTVTLDSVAPHVQLVTSTPLTAGSRPLGVELVVCHRNGSHNGVGVGPASSLAESCASVEPLALPATLDLGFSTTQVLYRVTLGEPGTYLVEGARVEYSQGFRRGTVEVPTGFSIATVGEPPIRR